MLIAVLSVTALTPLVRRLALRVGAVAQPGGRHVHQQSIPRLGGIAVTIAFFAPLLVLPRLDASVAAVMSHESAWLVGLVGGGVGMCALGTLDDTRGVRAIYKLL